VTTEVRARETARITAAVVETVERVFDTVVAVHEAALRSLTGDPGAGPGSDALGRERPALDLQLQHLLRASGRLVVGLGLVVAPRPELGLPLRLQWWQVDPVGGRLRVLEPDLKPASLGYYDYTSADWFDQPRRTGRRHVVGPYVDVHGTGQHLLTLTWPVVVAGLFVGVVGADVPVNRFETHLLQVLGPLRYPFVLLEGERRVVLSTSSRWLVGDLVPPSVELSGAGVVITDIPWRLHGLAPGGAQQGHPPGPLPSRPMTL